MITVDHMRVCRLAVAGLLGDRDEEASSALIEAVFNEVDADPDPDLSRQGLLLAALEMYTDILIRATGGVEEALTFLRHGLAVGEE